MLSLGGGLNRGRSAALAVSAALAIGAIPMTSALADDGPGGPGGTEPKPAPKHAPAPKPAPGPAEISLTNSAACQAAIATLQRYIAGDKMEDQLEQEGSRLNEDDPAEEQAETADQSEDQAERATSQKYHDAARTACEPQPVQVSAACVAAQTALTNYNGADRAEDQLEAPTKRADPDEDAEARAADQAEDQAEQATRQTYEGAVHTNCEPQPAQPSATCSAARADMNAFNAQDRIEDKAEQPAPGADADDNVQTESADQTEDQAENTHQHNLQAAVAQACGPAHPDHH